MERNWYKMTLMKSEKIIILLFIISAAVWAENSAPRALSAPEPELMCRSAILYDLGTDTLLYEKNADESIPPASMTKLMSLHLAYEAVEEGRISKTDYVQITPEASFKNSPPHSSLMFLEEGQKVTLLDLMIGLALPSGNDAGIALAEAVSGGMEAFVAQMNLECERLGLKHTSFVDSFGYSDKNTTTARDFAHFCRIYLTEHPESLEELHSLREYTYPREENIPEGKESTHGPITQYNHNNLVGRLSGVDGLKTGFIDESGYNIALTAERGGRRLLAVLMGGPGKNSREGSLNRAIDAAQLVTWGYTAFTTFTPELPEVPGARVWKGEEDFVDLVCPEAPILTLPRWEAAGLEFETVIDTLLIAPVPAGFGAGSVICRNSRNEEIFRLELSTAVEVREGSAFDSILDSLGLFFLGG